MPQGTTEQLSTSHRTTDPGITITCQVSTFGGVCYTAKLIQCFLRGFGCTNPGAASVLCDRHGAEIAGHLLSFLSYGPRTKKNCLRGTQQVTGTENRSWRSRTGLRLKIPIQGHDGLSRSTAQLPLVSSTCTALTFLVYAVPCTCGACGEESPVFLPMDSHSPNI